MPIFAFSLLVDQCREHLLRDRLVRRQRHALFEAIRVGVLAIPFLRLVALADRAGRLLVTRWPSGVRS